MTAYSRPAPDQSGFVRWRAGPAAKVTLVCLPWAGAGAAPFRAWADWLPADLELAALRLPGRESRFREPPIDDMGRLVAGIADTLQQAIERPFALFGHCSGALVAFEAARELRRRGGPRPECLVVASQASPRLKPGLDTDRSRDTRARLRRLGLTRPEILENDAMFEALRPVVEADLRLGDRYAYVPEEPLDVPISVLATPADASEFPEELADWKHETSGPFALRVLDVDRFVGDGWRLLAEAVAEAVLSG